MGFDALPISGEPKPLRSLAFDVYPRGVDPHYLRNRSPHLVSIGHDLRFLADDDGVDIGYQKSFVADKLDRPGEYSPALYAFYALIRIREVETDVRKAGRAKDRIGDGMEKDITVRMTEKTLAVRDCETAEKERPSVSEGVGIVTQADPHALPFI